ncbi:hypothetical protein B0H10DRAFT_2303954 [Mycena sp. CBHHK59/15]|nr:hypothetical protein B0H10DRAFT_2303954 [Mycena sp. CBHHK59/15]
MPSGCVDHGNTPLQPGETRTSMTQYAAGGLFRWVAYDFSLRNCCCRRWEGSNSEMGLMVFLGRDGSGH